MKKIILTAILAVSVMSSSAHAFSLSDFFSGVTSTTVTEEAPKGVTIKSGEVLTSDGEIKKASETVNGQRQLEAKGYVIGGGVVHIKGGVEVPLNELAGKNKEQIKDIIGEAAAEQLSDEELTSVSGLADSVANVAGDEIAAQVAENAAEAIASGEGSAELANAINDAIESGEITDKASFDDFMSKQ